MQKYVFNNKKDWKIRSYKNILIIAKKKWPGSNQQVYGVFHISRSLGYKYLWIHEKIPS